MRARVQPCTADCLPGNGALGLFLASWICAIDEAARLGFQCWRYQYPLSAQTHPADEIRGYHPTPMSRRTLGLPVAGTLVMVKNTAQRWSRQVSSQPMGWYQRRKCLKPMVAPTGIHRCRAGSAPGLMPKVSAPGRNLARSKRPGICTSGISALPLFF